MLSISLAQQLKEAGLAWTPVQRDFFAIPDRGLDDHIFVINFMTVGIMQVRGKSVVAFYGATELPLDDLPLSEAVWIPSEAQLRTLLEEHLTTQDYHSFRLTSTADGYLCQVQFQQEDLSFEAFGVAETYGLALLHMLTHTST